MLVFTIKKSGFTLIEVLVALVILSSVILGITKSYLMLTFQVRQLQQQDLVMTVLTELVQRSHRNLGVDYFQPEDWSRLTQTHAALLNCSSSQYCSNEQLRDFDVRWALEKVRDQMLQSQLELKSCVGSPGLCISVPSLLEFQVTATQSNIASQTMAVL